MREKGKHTLEQVPVRLQFRWTLKQFPVTSFDLTVLLQKLVRNLEGQLAVAELAWN